MVRLFNDQKVRDGLDRGDLIIEKFLPGDVYHADVLVESDRVLFLSVSRYVHKPYRFNKENYGSVMLDDSPKRYEISEVVAKFVRSLPRGHEVHVLHFEFIDDAENRATCGEVAARVGGGLIKQSIRYSFGIDMSQEFCRLELGLRAKIDSPNTRSLTGWLVRTGGPNLRVPARDLEWVVECKDDGVTKIPIDAADFAGTAIVTGRDELERRRHLSMLENLEACNNE
jgi:hypothetical protein